MNAIYMLPVNLYGPGDNFDLETSHVIPAMIRKFVEARSVRAPSVILWGDGSPTREFLFVEDAACAFRLALERYNGSEPINIGSGEEITIEALAGLIREVTDYQGDVIWDATKPNGQARRCLDTTRALRQLGFEAVTGLQVGIARTAHWFASNCPALSRHSESPR
jgi:GDP-L-fucose synthase